MKAKRDVKGHYNEAEKNGRMEMAERKTRRRWSKGMKYKGNTRGKMAFSYSRYRGKTQTVT